MVGCKADPLRILGSCRTLKFRRRSARARPQSIVSIFQLVHNNIRWAIAAGPISVSIYILYDCSSYFFEFKLVIKIR